MAISYVNLTKEIPTLISFARNDGWNYNAKLYIPDFLWLGLRMPKIFSLYIT